MGQFATQGGLSRALFQFANTLVGHFRGGMAMAAIVACALFGAVCGSSVATAATLAQVALPEMRRLNYSGRLATATLAVGGTLGILIPPSVPLVVYAILTEPNIAKLFLAAFIPGIIATIGYCIAIAIVVATQTRARSRSAAAHARRALASIRRDLAGDRRVRGRIRRYLRRRVHTDRGRGGRCSRNIRRCAAASRAGSQRHRALPSSAPR